MSVPPRYDVLHLMYHNQAMSMAKSDMSSVAYMTGGTKDLLPLVLVNAPRIPPMSHTSP